MTNYTPSEQEVREHYAEDHRDRYGSRLDAADGFDRWLAAHDAEVRASVLAEQGEPEWEYGIEYTPKTGVAKWHDGLESARRRLRYMRRTHAWAHDTARIVRRRKAGPWEPVEENTPTRTIRHEEEN